MRRTIFMTVCALALTGLAVSGCGGGGSSGGGGDQAKVKDVLIQDYAGKDPAKCGRIYTQKFLQSNWLGHPERCSKELASTFDVADPPKPSDLKIDQIKVSGSTATAREVNTTGGSPVRYSLVKDGGQWKIDSVDAA